MTPEAFHARERGPEKSEDALRLEPRVKGPDCRFYTAWYAGKEYSVVITDPSDEDDKKIFSAIHPEGPEIYIDHDLPEEYRNMFVIHEIVELEARLRGDQSPHEAHEYAQRAEDAYAHQKLNKERYDAYQKWREAFLKKHHARY